jgi:UDP-2,3-diacylglucosamine hydrolase
MPLEIKVNDKSTYYNLGDWVKYFTHGVFDGEKFELKTFKSKPNE